MRVGVVAPLAVVVPKAAGAEPVQHSPPMSDPQATNVRALVAYAEIENPATAPAAASAVLASTEEPDPELARQRLRRMSEPGGYLNAFTTFMFGEGLRFNNPYRLSRELGDSAESLSLTAPYVDMAVVLAGGSPTGLMHGGRLGWSIATSGVPQGTITPAYLVGLRPGAHWFFYAWVGVPILTAPDFNAGAELAVATTYFVRAGIGATAALVADGFYGAGTRETGAAFYPAVSAQLGVSLNYEVLP
jgi:hypothetical protein